VADYGAAEARFSDRLLRMNQAWAIFNKYLANGSSNNIGGSLQFSRLVDLSTDLHTA